MTEVKRTCVLPLEFHELCGNRGPPKETGHAAGTTLKLPVADGLMGFAYPVARRGKEIPLSRYTLPLLKDSCS
jgi:hypothetical protein